MRCTQRRRDHSSVSTARIPVRVQASARRNELIGIRDGVLTVRVTAPAIEGRANEALRRFLAKRLAVPRSAVTVIRGHRPRDKVIQIDGLDESTLLKTLTEEG
jgi:uncharacterized protein (TIGR00251 family)